MARIIAHLDMDAFFAAVEERESPKFKGLPLVIGADPRRGAGRGVVSTANYEARKYGIGSAMPISWAWRASEKAKKEGKPPAVFLRPDFRKYSAESKRIFEIIRRHAALIEQASIDEFYFDLSFAPSFGAAKKTCLKIKKEILDEERLTCSIGIGPNKLIAKIASDFRKPDGLTFVDEKGAESFIAPLPVRKIPGIGPKSEAMFAGLGIRLVGEVKRFSRDELAGMLGKWGAALYERVRGRDPAPLSPEHEAKSIGEQETFLRDTLEPDFLFARLSAMCGEVFARFRKSGFKAFRRVVLTVRFADFETKTRRRSLKEPACTRKALQSEAMKLLMPFLDERENPGKKLIRLVGVRVERIE